MAHFCGRSTYVSEDFVAERPRKVDAADLCADSAM